MKNVFRANRVRISATGLFFTLAAIGLAAEPAAAGGETIGYSAPFLSDPFQAIMADLTTKGAKDAGLDLLPVANANADAGKQISDIRTFLSQGAKGLIVVPVDRTPSSPRSTPLQRNRSRSSPSTSVRPAANSP